MRAFFVMFLLCTQAYAQERSPNLDLETARRAVAATGMNPGLIFPVGDYRYYVSSVISKQLHPNEFSVIIKINPLPIHRQ
jgi:hypothetical protein